MVEVKVYNACIVNLAVVKGKDFNNIFEGSAEIKTLEALHIFQSPHLLLTLEESYRYLRTTV